MAVDIYFYAYLIEFISDIIGANRALMRSVCVTQSGSPSVPQALRTVEQIRCTPYNA